MQIAVSVIVLILSVAGFLYIFYSSMNSVQKVGYSTFLLILVGAIMFPFIWIGGGDQQAQAASKQYDTQLQEGAALFGTYCQQCHGMQGQGLTGPKLNGNPTVNAISDADLLRIINAGIPSPSDPTKMQMPAWSEDYGGSLTPDDIHYLFELIRSSDPAYLAKNNLEDKNGFDYIYSQLANDSAKATYTAQLQASQFHVGPPKDFTNTSNVSMEILNQTGGAVPWGFQYDNITIKAGTTVTWTDTSTAPHTVVSGLGGVPDGKFSTPAGTILQPNNQGAASTYSFTFTQPGVYKYYCSLHPSMVAQITVQ